MLTDDQKKWINHLSDTDAVKIVPYNQKVKEIFSKQKTELQSILGNDTAIVHRGASSLGIPGKGEVDLYIPVEESQFDSYLEKLQKAYGDSNSLYHKERARFNRKHEGILVEIFLINQNSQGWKDG